MKQIIYKCDVCNKECEEDEMLHTDDHDVCEECLKKIVDEHFKAETKTEKPKKAKTDKPKKKPIDFGKAQALRNAKWTLEAIADELGCSVATICKHTVAKEGV